METLDEKGFVFIDHKNRPYWCRMYFDEPWIMYWHEGQKSWVTLRTVTQSEIWKFNSMAISDEQTEIYHNQHQKYLNGTT